MDLQGRSFAEGWVAEHRLDPVEAEQGGEGKSGETGNLNSWTAGNLIGGAVSSLFCF